MKTMIFLLLRVIYERHEPGSVSWLPRVWCTFHISLFST